MYLKTVNTAYNWYDIDKKTTLSLANNGYYLLIYYYYYYYYCGPGSSFGIATDYGPDCSGSNPGGDEIFRSSRPALGPTQPPVQWVPGLSRG